MSGFMKNKKQLTKRQLQEQVGDQASNAVKMIQGLAVVVNQQIRNLNLQTSNLAAMSIMRDDPKGKVASNNLTYIDFIGRLKNEDGSLGEPFEGGDGIGVFVDMQVHQFLSDFQDNLIGMSAGEVKTFDVKFPENFGSKELAGKTAQFKVQVRKVMVEIASEVAEEVLALQKARELKKAQAQSEKAAEAQG
jgi:trigger factor